MTVVVIPTHLIVLLAGFACACMACKSIDLAFSAGRRWAEIRRLRAQRLGLQRIFAGLAGGNGARS